MWRPKFTNASVNCRPAEDSAFSAAVHPWRHAFPDLINARLDSSSSMEYNESAPADTCCAWASHNKLEAPLCLTAEMACFVSRSYKTSGGGADLTRVATSATNLSTICPGDKGESVSSSTKAICDVFGRKKDYNSRSASLGLVFLRAAYLKAGLLREVHVASSTTLLYSAKEAKSDAVFTDSTLVV